MRTLQKWTSSLLFVFITILSAAQASPSAMVTIPFDFWIGARQLPAGDYVIDRGDGPDVLLFRTQDGKQVQQVFLIPARGAVEGSDRKLVFTVRKGRFYLVELWGLHGRRILTARYGLPSLKGDTRREIAVSNGSNAVW